MSVRCRVCFGDHRTLLTGLCKCRGELSMIHEKCLLKWLQMQQTDRCELCLQPYKLKKKLPSLWELLTVLLNYAKSSRSRLLITLAYPVAVIFGLKFLRWLVKLFIEGLKQPAKIDVKRPLHELLKPRVLVNPKLFAASYLLTLMLCVVTHEVGRGYI